MAKRASSNIPDGGADEDADRPTGDPATDLDERLHRYLADYLPQLVWILDADYRFRFVNRRWTEYTGLTFDQSNQIGWEAVIEPEDLAAVERIRQIARGTGDTGEIAARLRSGDGRHRWFLIRSVPLPPDMFGAGCWLGTATDIDEQRRSEDIRLFVADLDRRMRAAPTPEDVLAEVVGKLCKRLDASRCTFLEIHLDTDISHRFKVYQQAGAKPLPDWFDRSVLPQEIQETLMAGGTVVVDDIRTDPRVGDGERVSFTLDACAFVAVPIIRQAVHVGTLAVAEADHARTWLPQEVALIQTVAERTWLAMESTAHFRKGEAADRMRRTFARDALFVATDGCLRLCETADDLPAPLLGGEPEIDLRERAGVAALRRAVSETAVRLGFDVARRCDLVLAVGEAAINAVVHGGGGTARVYDDGRETIQVWVLDQGAGIHFDILPRATMARGFSTASSLGQGFKMILDTADRVYLLTDPSGTTVVIEHDRVPPDEFSVQF